MPLTLGEWRNRTPDRPLSLILTIWTSLCFPNSVLFLFFFIFNLYLWVLEVFYTISGGQYSLFTLSSSLSAFPCFSAGRKSRCHPDVDVEHETEHLVLGCKIHMKYIHVWTEAPLCFCPLKPQWVILLLDSETAGQEKVIWHYQVIASLQPTYVMRKHIHLFSLKPSCLLLQQKLTNTLSFKLTSKIQVTDFHINDVVKNIQLLALIL